MTNDANNKLAKRKNPIHLSNIEHFNQPIIIYVTVCTKNRKKVLATETMHNTLQKIWKEDQQYMVGKYIIMPDHIHLFCSPIIRDAKNVKDWVAFWKRKTSIELKNLKPLWQRDFWDRQLRNGESYSDKWEYIRQNPVRKNLVNKSEDWLYQGELNELRW